MLVTATPLTPPLATTSLESWALIEAESDAINVTAPAVAAASDVEAM